MKKKNIFYWMCQSMLFLFCNSLLAQVESKAVENSMHYEVNFHLEASTYNIGQLAQKIKDLKSIINTNDTIEIHAFYDHTFFEGALSASVECNHIVKFELSLNGETEEIDINPGEELLKNKQKEFYNLFLQERKLKEHGFSVATQVTVKKDIKQKISINVKPMTPVYSEKESLDEVQNALADVGTNQSPAVAEAIAGDDKTKEETLSGNVKTPADSLHLNNMSTPPTGRWTQLDKIKVLIKALKEEGFQDGLDPQVELEHIEDSSMYRITYTYSNYARKYKDVESIDKFVEGHLALWIDNMRDECSDIKVIMTTETYESDEILSYPSKEKFNKYDFADPIQAFPCFFESKGKTKEVKKLTIEKEDISILEQEFLKLYYLKDQLKIKDGEVEIVIASDTDLEAVKTTLEFIARY